MKRRGPRQPKSTVKDLFACGCLVWMTAKLFEFAQLAVDESNSIFDVNSEEFIQAAKESDNFHSYGG